MAGKLNLKEREYHAQEDADVFHKYVKMFCNKNKCSLLSFCGPHTKSHGVIGLGKHYHIRFDPKL